MVDSWCGLNMLFLVHWQQEVEITKGSSKKGGGKKGAKGAAARAVANKLRRAASLNTPGTSPGMLGAPSSLDTMSNNIESAGDSSSPPALTVHTPSAAGSKLAHSNTSQTQVRCESFVHNMWLVGLKGWSLNRVMRVFFGGGGRGEEY